MSVTRKRTGVDLAGLLSAGAVTSSRNSVVVSRAIVNLVYGHRRKVAKLHIGNTAWK